MSSGSITEADQARLQRVLERNRARGDRIKQGQRESTKTYQERLRESDAFDVVRSEIEALADDGRNNISVREVAERVDVSDTVVGQAMSLLGDDGELTLVSKHHPKTWRIER